MEKKQYLCTRFKNNKFNQLKTKHYDTTNENFRFGKQI